MTIKTWLGGIFLGILVRLGFDEVNKQDGVKTYPYERDALTSEEVKTPAATIQTKINIPSMLRRRLELSEGIRYNVYKDKYGYLTVGIGHLILPSDHLFYGDDISFDRLNEFYDKDSKRALARAFFLNDKFYKITGQYHDEFIISLADVCFQLGTNFNNKFTRWHQAMLNKNYEAARREVLNSKWHKQTPRRAEAFARMMDILASNS